MNFCLISIAVSLVSSMIKQKRFLSNLAGSTKSSGSLLSGQSSLKSIKSETRCNYCAKVQNPDFIHLYRVCYNCGKETISSTKLNIFDYLEADALEAQKAEENELSMELVDTYVDDEDFVQEQLNTETSVGGGSNISIRSEKSMKGINGQSNQSFSSSTFSTE